jgi:hypothetical protein
MEWRWFLFSFWLLFLFALQKEKSKSNIKIAIKRIGKESKGWSKSSLVVTRIGEKFQRERSNATKKV